MRTLAALALLLAPAPARQEPRDPKTAETLRRLETQRVSVDFRDASLDDAVESLRGLTGLDFHVDDGVRARWTPDQLKVTLKLQDVLVRTVLKLALRPRDLTAVVRAGAVVILPRDRVNAAVVTRIYNVQALLHRIEDFPGPEVDLKTPSGGRPLGGATFQLEMRFGRPSGPESLVELVKGCTGDRSWEEEGRASISHHDGRLVVTQTQKVQDQVDRLLVALAQFK